MSETSKTAKIILG